MRRQWDHLESIVALVVVFVAFALVALLVWPRDIPVDRTDTTCVEDEACWDCTTMGNLRCGPSKTANR